MYEREYPEKIDIMYNDFVTAQNRMCKILRDVIVHRVLLRIY